MHRLEARLLVRIVLVLAAVALLASLAVGAQASVGALPSPPTPDRASSSLVR